MKIMVPVRFTMDTSYNIECGHVRDDPKLPGDSGEYLFPNGVVGGLIPIVKSSLYLTK